MTYDASDGTHAVADNENIFDKPCDVALVYEQVVTMAEIENM